jgi:hypothetical protein
MCILIPTTFYSWSVYSEPDSATRLFHHELTKPGMLQINYTEQNDAKYILGRGKIFLFY